MDVDKLLNALDNEKNESVINLSTSKILKMNLDILKQLHLDKQTTLTYLKKVKGYKYVDELDQLRFGSCIYWIPISNPTYLPLHHGIICDANFTDKGVLIRCKNFMHRHYTFKMDECLIFQKLSQQESIIIAALDHLEKNKKIEELTHDEENDEENDEEDEEDEDEED